MSLIAGIVLHVAWWLDRRFRVNGSVVGAIAKGRQRQRMETTLRYFSWKKLWNFIRVELQLRAGKSWLSASAYEWEIDTTNICQLKCPLCHTGLGNIHRDQGTMHFGTYAKVIDEIKDYCMWLSLYSWGEPFLNKNIDKFVAYAHEAKIATIISSNLNKPLTREMAQSLIRSGLDVLIVSIDGTTQEVYQQYRVTGHLDRVMENLKLLAQTKRELRSKTPFIEWQFIVMRQNEHQIDEARRIAGEIGVDGIVFKKVDFPLGEEDPEVARKWLPTDASGFSRDEPFDRPFQENGDRCWRLWRSSVINWDGGYAPCCYLTDAKDDFGNVGVDSIKSIWNNEHYRSARELFNAGGEPTRDVGCVTCPVYLETEPAKARGHRSSVQVNERQRAVEIPLIAAKHGEPRRAIEEEKAQTGPSK